MWEMIKNDPILKTIVVVILGVFSFGFAFNVMFGTNSGAESNMEMSGGGYSLNNTLSNMLSLLVHIFLIVVIISFIIMAIKFINNYLIKNKEIEIFKNVKNDKVVKVVAGLTALVLVLIVVHFSFSGSVTRIGYGMSNFSVVSMLTILVKTLLYISVIGFITGALMYFKKHYMSSIVNFTAKEKKATVCKSCGVSLSGDYKYCPDCGNELKEKCKSCGTELNEDWQCCPECGKDKNEPNNNEVDANEN